MQTTLNLFCLIPDLEPRWQHKSLPVWLISLSGGLHTTWSPTLMKLSCSSFRGSQLQSMTSLLTLRTCGVPGSARKELGCDARWPAVLRCQSYCDDPLTHIHSLQHQEDMFIPHPDSDSCYLINLPLAAVPARIRFKTLVLAHSVANGSGPFYIQVMVKPCTPGSIVEWCPIDRTAKITHDEMCQKLIPEYSVDINRP